LIIFASLPLMPAFRDFFFFFFADVILSSPAWRSQYNKARGQHHIAEV